MAKKERVVIDLIDDFGDGAGDRTIYVGLNGVWKELDLSDENATGVEEQLRKWMAAGRDPKPADDEPALTALPGRGVTALNDTTLDDTALDATAGDNTDAVDDTPAAEESTPTTKATLRAVAVRKSPSTTGRTRTTAVRPATQTRKKTSPSKKAPRKSLAKGSAKRPGKGSLTSGTARTATTADRRAWALANGFELAGHGRLPRHVDEAFAEAHGGGTRKVRSA